MLKLVTKKKLPPKPVTLREHYQRRNKILIKRICGGSGDTLICRMMFEDFAKSFPEAEVTFTCPHNYIALAENHPYAKAVSLREVDEYLLESQYGVIYDIATACRTHELKWGPKNTSNRSDIWAAHCGVELRNHEMYLTPEPEMLGCCGKLLAEYNKEGKPKVLVVTQSQHHGLRTGEDDFGIGKSIDSNQLPGIIHGLRERGCYPYTVHSEKRADYEQLGVDQFTGLAAHAWIAMVALADYVITIDTAALHMAGGLKIPTVAIFTFTNSNPYTKHYSNMELIQGPCPFSVPGCLTTYLHCKKGKNDPFPCQVGIGPSDILAAFDRLVARFPLGKLPPEGNVQKNRRIDLLVHTA
jgi:hypothetical protein